MGLNLRCNEGFKILKQKLGFIVRQYNNETPSFEVSKNNLQER